MSSPEGWNLEKEDGFYKQWGKSGNSNTENHIFYVAVMDGVEGSHQAWIKRREFDPMRDQEVHSEIVWSDEDSNHRKLHKKLTSEMREI